MLGEGDPRWPIGQGIRITELCDFRNHFETWEIHLGNSESF
jgi:hypothetical protein